MAAPVAAGLQAYAPSWSARQEIFEVENATYLTNQVRGTKKDPARSVNQFLEEQQVRHLKLEHDRLVRTYELRARYGLLTRQEERVHHDAVRTFSKNMALIVGRNQMKTRLEKVREFAEKDAVIGILKQPAAVIALAYAIYNGQPLQTGLGKDVSLRARSNMPVGETEVSVANPVLNASFYLRTNSLSEEDARRRHLQDPSQREERMRVSGGRSLGVLGLYSTVSYGSSTESISGSLSKQLTAQLNATVTSRKPLNSKLDRGEDVIHLNYGVSF